MQRFPQVEENSLNNTRPFRSSDYINSNHVEVLITKSKSPVPVGNGRARSCSGGRNKTVSPPVLTRKSNCLEEISREKKWNISGSCGPVETNTDIDKRTRKITHRIAELFSLIKENQSDRYELFSFDFVS